MSTNEKIAGQAEDMELTPEKFKIIGFTQEEANKIDRPTISYWQDAWRRLRKNPVAMVSMMCFGTADRYWLSLDLICGGMTI